ncbi:MAG: hypothetical protein ACKO2P_03560 [Planctomycetota bacterium]
MFLDLSGQLAVKYGTSSQILAGSEFTELNSVSYADNEFIDHDADHSERFKLGRARRWLTLQIQRCEEPGRALTLGTEPFEQC